MSLRAKSLAVILTSGSMACAASTPAQPTHDAVARPVEPAPATQVAPTTTTPPPPTVSTALPAETAYDPKTAFDVVSNARSAIRERLTLSLQQYGWGYPTNVALRREGAVLDAIIAAWPKSDDARRAAAIHYINRLAAQTELEERLHVRSQRVLEKLGMRRERRRRGTQRRHRFELAKSPSWHTLAQSSGPPA